MVYSRKVLIHKIFGRWDMIKKPGGIANRLGKSYSPNLDTVVRESREALRMFEPQSCYGPFLSEAAKGNKRKRKSNLSFFSMEMLGSLEARNRRPTDIGKLAEKAEKVDPGGRRAHELAKKYYK
jgi:hypothetical protein